MDFEVQSFSSLFQDIECYTTSIESQNRDSLKD